MSGKCFKKTLKNFQLFITWPHAFQAQTSSLHDKVNLCYIVLIERLHTIHCFHSLPSMITDYSLSGLPAVLSLNRYTPSKINRSWFLSSMISNYRLKKIITPIVFSKVSSIYKHLVKSFLDADWCSKDSDAVENRTGLLILSRQTLIFY